MLKQDVTVQLLEKINKEATETQTELHNTIEKFTK